MKDWENAAATVSHKTIIEPNTTVKIPITAKTFPFDGRKVAGPILTACTVDCTELPILGKDQIAQFDNKGNAHILIDNPLDIPVTLERGSYVGSVERVNLAECAEVRFDMSSSPLSTPPTSSSPSREKRELLTNAINEQLKH